MINRQIQIRFSTIIFLQILSFTVMAQDDAISPENLKTMQTLLVNEPSANVIERLRTHCKDTGGNEYSNPLKSEKGQVIQAEITCHMPIRMKQQPQVDNTITPSDISGAVGEAITSNSSNISSASSSLPILGTALSLFGAVGEIKRSNAMVEESKKRVEEMQNAINKFHYEVTPGSKVNTASIRLRLYRTNQSQVTDQKVYEEKIQDLRKTLGL